MNCILRIGLAFLLFHAFGCGEVSAPRQESPEKIMADFYIRYMQDEQKILAEATFQKGDTLTRLQPAKFQQVQFLGEGMNTGTHNLQDIYYRSQVTGPFPERFDFSITNEQDQTFNYKMQMSPVADFLIKGGKIEKSKGLSLAWQGSTLQSNETMILFFQDRKEHSLSAILRGSTSDIQFNLPPEKLRDLALGKGILYLVKKQTNQIIRQDTTIHSIIEFYTKVVPVDITE